MISMIFLIIILVLIVLDSIYCFLMKKRSSFIKDCQFKDKRTIENDSHKKPYSNSKGRLIIVRSLLQFFNDLTFLACKLVGYIPFHSVRMFFYKYVFHMSLGKKVVIYYGLETRFPWNIIIDNGSIIGDKAILDARYGIKIGTNVNLSTGVWIWTQQHDVNSPFFSTDGKQGPVIIGDRAWISSRTSILPNNVISNGCVLAAGAVLTKCINEPYSIWGGLPAKRIGNRNANLKYNFDGKHRFFL